MLIVKLVSTQILILWLSPWFLIFYKHHHNTKALLPHCHPHRVAADQKEKTERLLEVVSSVSSTTTVDEFPDPPEVYQMLHLITYVVHVHVGRYIHRLLYM